MYQTKGVHSDVRQHKKHPSDVGFLGSVFLVEGMVVVSLLGGLGSSVIGL